MRVDVRLFAVFAFLCSGSLHTQPATAQVTSTDRSMLLARTGQQQSDSLRIGPPEAKEERRISIDLNDVELKEAIRRVANDARVAIFYNDRDVPARARVSVRMSNASVTDVLQGLLHDSRLRLRRVRAGFVIERRGVDAETSKRDTTGTLKGVAVDSTSGSPVSGAGITLVGTGLRTVTDTRGEFEIPRLASGSYVVDVRVLGYARKTAHVVLVTGDTTFVTLSLVPVPRVLDQVVTTATGDRRKVEVGNAIAVIHADSVVNSAPVTTLSDILATRVAGLQVYFPGGLTGASPQINVRGQNSLSLSNQPLLYVDGVRVENSVATRATVPVAVGGGSGRFDDLIPSEIESIEVVKGPSAATLYGTDAANGVILVRTKRGTPGPARWSIFAEGGRLQLDRTRFRTNYYPWGHATTGEPVPVRCPLRSVAAAACVQDSVTSFSPLLDPETTPIGSGSRYSAGAQVMGGSGVRYFLSGTLEHEIGYLKMPDADRALLEAQAGHPLGEEALHPNAARKYAGRLNVTIPVSSSADVIAAVGLNSLRLRVPTPLLLDAADDYGIRDAYDGWRDQSRPGDAFVKRNRQDVTHLTGSLQSDWRPTAWLAAHVTAGLDYASEYDDRLARAGIGFLPYSTTGARENTKVTTSASTVDGNAVIKLPLGAAVESRTTVGVQYSRRLELLNTAGAQQLTPGSGTVAGGAVLLASETTTETIVAGTYAEQTFGLHERLYVTLAARADGASAFGRGFQTALYPKASMSWLLSDESFWPHIPGISSVRFRAAYGESGVQPGPLDAISSELLFPALVGDASTTGAGLGSLGNDDLKPERQREVEIGIDLQAFDGRANVALTRYDKKSKDALVSLPEPASLGGGTRWENVGAVRNWGYEAELSMTLLEHTNVRWSMSVSGSINDNKVLNIAPGIDALYQSVYPSIVRGYPLFSYFYVPITGFQDANGDGILAENEISVGSSRAFAGRSYPRTQLSATTELGLLRDRLRISASIERRAGYRLLDHDWVKCALDACAGAVLPDAPFGEQAAAQARHAPSLGSTSWGFVRDASFTRLRELSLTYSLSDNLLNTLGISGLSATLSARNLALWTRYPGADPEVQTALGRASNGAGYDRTGPPPPTYWLIKLQVKP